MPGHVFENLIILGSAVGEGYDDPPGWIRAYDVITGKLVWTFHTIPLPGEYGYDTWPPDAYKYTGGANIWVEFFDRRETRHRLLPDRVLPPTTCMAPGGKGMNLFANCLLALDARTGKRLWHFQTIHHDLWDYDNCNEPKLLTVNHDGKKVDIVAMGTKTGHAFCVQPGDGRAAVADRGTARAEERRAGRGSLAHAALPDQAAALLAAEDDGGRLNPYVEPRKHERLRKIFLAARHEGIFTPITVGAGPNLDAGRRRGHQLGRHAPEIPQTGMLYVRAENMPAIHRLFERSRAAGVLRRDSRAAGPRALGAAVRIVSRCRMRPA